MWEWYGEGDGICKVPGYRHRYCRECLCRDQRHQPFKNMALLAIGVPVGNQITRGLGIPVGIAATPQGPVYIRDQYPLGMINFPPQEASSLGGFMGLGIG